MWLHMVKSVHVRVGFAVFWHLDGQLTSRLFRTTEKNEQFLLMFEHAIYMLSTNTLLVAAFNILNLLTLAPS